MCGQNIAGNSELHFTNVKKDKVSKFGSRCFDLIDAIERTDEELTASAIQGLIDDALPFGGETELFIAKVIMELEEYVNG